MKIDFGKYLEFLGTEKYRSIVIHNISSKSLSQFAQQAAVKYNGVYFDLLYHFRNHKKLAKQVDVFGVAELVALLTKKSKDQSLVVVDKTDFLLDTWQKKEKNAFYRLIKNQWNSFLKGREAIIVFCLLTNDDLEDLKIFDTKKNSRVHQLSNFKAIK